MRKVIYKYPIFESGKLELPDDAEILCLKVQFGNPYVWAIVDLDIECENTNRSFMVYPTGTLIPDSPGKYVDTFFISQGSLVYHLFETTNVK